MSDRRSQWVENKTFTILIVDDDEVNREFFEVMLKRLNFNIESAVDGEEALEKIREGKISLVLLDNLLPKYSGWEVTRIIRNEPDYEFCKNIPIIMFSAMNTTEGKIKGYDLGIDDYITKPFNFVEVLARIKAVLRHRAVMDQVTQREKQIAVVDALNKSLVYFSQHIREPIEQLHVLSQQSQQSNEPAEAVKKLCTALYQETEKILKTLANLENERSELEKQREELKGAEVGVDALNKEYGNVFEELKDQNSNG